MAAHPQHRTGRGIVPRLAAGTRPASPLASAPQHLLPALLPRVAPLPPRVFTARVQGQDLARRGSFNSSPSSPREMGVIPGDANWCSDQGRAVPRDAITDGLGTVASLLPSLLPCIRHSHTRARTHPRPRTSAYMQIANTKRQLSCLLIYDFFFFFLPP